MELEESNKYSRGSIWRKWDLHVHTPCSLNQEYGGDTVEVWEKFISDLEKLPKEFKVIGINDYIFLDGYKKVIDFKKKGRLPNIDLILPVIELRIDKLGSVGDKAWKKVNFHVIFSNEVTVEQIEQQFLNAITHSHVLSPDYSDLNFSGVITRESLIDFGNKIKESSSGNVSGSDISVGFNNITYGYEKLLSALNSTYFTNKFLTAVGKTEWDSLRWDGSVSDKKTIINKANLVFISSESPDKFEIAKNKLKEQNVNYNLIDCSDAHSFSSAKDTKDNYIKDRIGKCFTWIKADPSFEGLKQIIYEPEDRVRIQELSPDEKEDYQVIDKVKFIDNDFLTNDILINQNLTAIIGGKSTGKSVLLRNIAQSIDPKEVDNRLKEVGLDSYPKQVSDFRVIWKDRQENKKNDTGIINKKIIYIPQSYLNRLVDKKEGKTSIDDIIKNVLDQDPDIRSVFNDLDFSKREIEKVITKNIEDLFYVKNDIKKLSENIKTIGDKKGIRSEVEKLKVEITDLQSKSGMKQESVDKYNELTQEKEKLNHEKELCVKDIRILNNIKNKTTFNKVDFENISDYLKESLVKSFDLIVEKYLLEWHKELVSKIDSLIEKDNSIFNLIEKNNESLKPLVKMLVESKSLDDKIKKLAVEEDKLKNITLEENKLLKLKGTYKSLIEDISLNHSNFFERLFSSISKIIKQTIIVDELEFNIDTSFEENSFKKYFIDEVCNLRNINQFEEGFLSDYTFSSNEKFKDDIKKIITGILENKLTLKNSYSKKEAITKLVRNWFYFDYIIKQNGDKISEMSPGKKSFVLLKLLIELDNSKCPILLDQPEDDLDNRSIYNDLVNFIKSKKKDRQIIIATHNPNLVVGADAECIIVANQRGNKIEEVQIFKFEYVGGALENTFVKKEINEVLYKQGIQEHVCDILEGGKVAFEQRREKYNLT